MNEKKLSELQKEYRIFFLQKMELYGVKSPAQLTKEKKSEFFNEVKQDWASIKLLRKQFEEADSSEIKSIVEEDTEKYIKKGKQGSDVNQPTKEKIRGDIDLVNQPQEVVQKIKSLPNQDQTDDLRILFNPNNHFEQEEQYLYPVVKMPMQNALLKLPRAGRTNQKGYKENDFYTQIKSKLVDFEIANDVHMVIPNFNKPYEPDIVLFDKKLNLYIDIEID